MDTFKCTCIIWLSLVVFTVLFLKFVSVVFVFITAGQFVKHKLPDLLRSYTDAGKKGFH